MMIYKKILLSIDGSETSNLAVQEVTKFANDRDVKLRIIHIVDELFLSFGGGTFDYLSYISLKQEEGEKILNDAMKTITSHTNIKVETSLIELNDLKGRIAELIVDEAKKWGADLLVIGTHGRHGFSRLFLGSVAENTIRIATIPVLLVPGSAKGN